MPLNVSWDESLVSFSFSAQDGTSLPTDAWVAAGAHADREALSALFSLVESEAANVIEPRIHISHAQVAKLAARDAKLLKLPPDFPLRLDIRSDGDITNPSFLFDCRWIGTDGLPYRRELEWKGCLVSSGQRVFRLPDPQFTVLKKIKAFNQNPPEGRDDRLLQWGAIRSLLGESPEEIRNDYYLRDTRIYSARRFTLRIDPLGMSDASLTPVLVGAEPGADLSGVEQKAEGASSVLPEHYQDVFANRFTQFDDARTVYPLEDGTYVVIDPVCREALRVVKKAMSGTAADRLALVRNPRAALAAALGDSVAQDVLEDLFVETEAFSARVSEIGLWQKKILPWVQRKGEAWLPPEALGLMIGGERVEIPQEKLAPLAKEIESLLKTGGGEVAIEALKVPVSEDLLGAVNTLVGEAAPDPEPRETTGKPAEAPVSKARNVLLIKDNFENIDYAGPQREHRLGAHELPVCLKTRLKDHQNVGLRWLQDHWIQGSPGALLADDMGLGKTLQVLAFAAWLREEMAVGMTPHRPILVVAPVGLLRNWETEHERHLIAPGLGNLVAAYDVGLRRLRRSAINELRSGQSALDREALQSADWILTSYESLRDYQFSFGLIQFAMVVFDEAQKIKTPGTLSTEAAKAVRAEFSIAMTGTPVENRLADMWCLIDTAQPGVLGDLKSFSKVYESQPSEETLQGLKARIWHGPGGTDKCGLMLRRMKEDSLDALPKKHVHLVQRVMPPLQANAYSSAVRQGKGAEGAAILKVLHGLRSVSLHPVLRQSENMGSDEDWINCSARLAATVEILDGVRSKGEKALIFLESLDMQDARELPLVLQKRFRLAAPPLVINGTVAAPERQKRVERFQREEGFGIMILSPRAGGVGITLTAANHVIHLSRWWNPAVEDQSTDRVYRIGQTREVHVYCPIAVHPHYGEHSFDFKLHGLIQRKRELSRALLVPSGASDADVAALFSDTIVD